MKTRILRIIIVSFWIAISAIQPVNASSRIAAGKNASGCIELFFVDTINKLYHRQQHSFGEGWSTDEWISDSVSGLLLCKHADESLMLFYTCMDGTLYCRYQTLPEYQWTNAEKFAAQVKFIDWVTDGEDRINVFYITTDNRLIQRYQLSPGSWSDDVQRADYAKKVTAGRNEDGRMEIFYTISGDTLYHKYQLAPGGDWSDGNYFSIPAQDLESCRNEDGRLEVFFIDTADTLRHKWQVAVNSGWSGHAVFAGYARKVLATANQDGRMEVFYTADNNYLYHRWQIAVNDGWDAGEQCGWAAYEITAALNEDGRLEVFYTGNDGVLFHNWQLQPGLFWAGEYPFIDEDQPLITFETYNAEPDYLPEVNWHVNDHCFISDEDGYWHMFGIVYPDPYSGIVNHVNYFGHANSAAVVPGSWNKMDPPFYESLHEGDVLWAPHVIYHENTYYMFYCGGGPLDSYEICLRTSPDLINWSDYRILFRDGIQARDPMVLWLEKEQCWVMYYTATYDSSGGYYVVAYRTSNDLYNWSERNIAYVDYHSGTTYGNTESPFVVNRGQYYYLFIGPRPYDLPTEDMENWEHPGYVGTDIFRSTRWNKWTNADIIGHTNAHAPEIIYDGEGNWYASHCGVLQGGLFLRQMHWYDGITSDHSHTVNTEGLFLSGTNYPNPFCRSTCVKFRVPATDLITLKVYNTVGRLMATLVEEEMKPGCYEVIWDAGNLPGGVYYYKLETVSFAECRAMILVK
ncbi:MAG: family 43 glycosylhydrolase [Bacteroidales bacterium]|nr:family 43 glycosylhydrolase [Bacteroidales bacterium]